MQLPSVSDHGCYRTVLTERALPELECCRGHTGSEMSCKVKITPSLTQRLKDHSAELLLVLEITRIARRSSKSAENLPS